jgi:purine-binding chemotaxis protein CheW
VTDIGATQRPARASGSLDWAQIRRRVDNVNAAFERAVAPAASEKARILKVRAKALAREPDRAAREELSLEVVEFVLAYERYALDVSFVREVHPLKDITVLPGTPAFVAGIVNVRGRIVSVVDLKRFFDLPAKGLTDLNKVIILNDGQMEFGLLVDAVIAVHRLALSAIQPGPPTLAGVRAAYLQGVTAQRTVILNAAKLLADPAILRNQ